MRFASARMNSPTNFVVSSEIGSVSTAGSIDAVQQSTFSGSIRQTNQDDTTRGELLAVRSTFRSFAGRAPAANFARKSHPQHYDSSAAFRIPNSNRARTRAG